MKYIGNKTRLIPFIESCLQGLNINYQNRTVVDLFSGTGSVSEFFMQHGCEVFSCDNMNYAIAEQYRKLYFRQEPQFPELRDEIGDETLEVVLAYLNRLELKEGYFFENYCQEGRAQRNYFKKENAKKIDAIREKIEEWKPLLPKEKYMFLLGILMDAADFVSNTAGTYGAYLKIWRSMALKELEMQMPGFIPVGNIHLLRNDVMEALEDIPEDADITYMDPPYNTRQYAANFHVLESIVVYDKQPLQGKSGLRSYEKQKSKFSMKSEVKEEFRRLIEKIHSNYIVMSYSTEGILAKEDIEEILRQKGELHVFDKDYRRFKTNAWTDNQTNLKELLFVCVCR